jgi:hypothetical protein
MPKASYSRLLLVAITLVAGGCASNPSLVQVVCEQQFLRKSTGSKSLLYNVRRAKYWSDGSTTYEPIYSDIDVQEGGWQLVYIQPGADPC